MESILSINIPAITKKLQSFPAIKLRELDDYLMDVSNKIYDVFEQLENLQPKIKDLNKKEAEHLLKELKTFDEQTTELYDTLYDISTEHDSKNIDRINNTFDMIGDELIKAKKKLNDLLIT